MLRLVAQLPALFRRGVVPDNIIPKDGPFPVPREGENLQELCTEGIKALEIVVSNLEPGTLKRLQVPPLERIRTTSARAPATWRQFLEDVPDRGLELSTLWATARAFQTALGTDHEQTPEQETQLQDLALLAFWRRCFLVHAFLMEQRLSERPAAEVAILRPSLKAEIQMLQDLLTALLAGSSGAATVAARAQATRDGATARRAAATAAAQALLERSPAPRRRVAPAAPVQSAVPPVEPPNSTVEGIQRWIHSVRSTGAVAANASDGDWRRQLQVLRAGLTGTAVCLGDPGAITSPTSSMKIRSESECPICLEMLPAGTNPEKVIPLPCGHSFHSSCASQWLQKCPRCPVCRHSPFLPLEVKKTLP